VDSHNILNMNKLQIIAFIGGLIIGGGAMTVLMNREDPPIGAGLVLIQTNQIVDSYLLNTGDTSTGAYTFAGQITSETKNLSNYADFFNGTFLEAFDATTTSDGSIVTLNLQDKATNNALTMRFSDGDGTLVTPTSTALTAGTDASPTENYVYILKTTDALTVSTSDWPATEHIKVAYLLVPSATFVQNTGVYLNQNWNDGAMGSTNQGHLSHITEQLRLSGAVYHSGVDGNGDSSTYVVRTDAAPDTVTLKSTAGVVFQMHRQAYPAQDTSGSDIFTVVNENGNAHATGTDLYNFLSDADGDSMSNNYYNLVLWGSANKTGSLSPIKINLPTCSYNKLADAKQDTSGCDVFTIPDAFLRESSTGFLIARLTMDHTAAGQDLELNSTVDLRGLTPAGATGGTAAGNLTDFADNTFTVFDDLDVTKILAFQASGITTATTRTLTIPDANGTIALTNGNVGTGVWDLGGATSVEIVNGASPTVNVAGEIALDTTANQLVIATSTASEIVIPNVQYSRFHYASSTWTGTTTLGFGGATLAPLTIQKVNCYLSAGTAKLSLKDDAGNISNTLALTTSTSTQAFTTNNGFNIDDSPVIQIGTPASSPQSVSCTLEYTYDRQ